MKTIMTVLFASVCAVLSAFPEYTRELENPGGESGTALTEIFAPEGVNSFSIRGGDGKKRRVRILNREGGKFQLLFTVAPREKMLLTMKPGPPGKNDGSLKSGFLHEYKSFSGETVESAEEFNRLWSASGKNYRAAPDVRVYSGGNKLGEARNSLNRYSGFLVVPEEGEWTFHTASTDASFLRIDGKTVAAYPGRHHVYPALYGEYKGTVRLSKGVHEFEYLHANNQWSYYAIAAWSRKGWKKMKILQKENFLPFREVRQGELRRDGKKIDGLSWKRSGTIDIDGRQLSEYSLDNGKKIYFFNPGEAQMHGGYRIQNAYHFAPEMVSGKRGREILWSLWKSESSLSEDAFRFLAAAIPVFKMKDLASEFYREILRKGDEMPLDAVFKFYKLMMKDEFLEKENYEHAVSELKKMTAKLGAPAALELAEMQFYYQGRRDEGIQTFRAVKYGELPESFQRAYRILEADIALFESGFDAASKLYSAMETDTSKMSYRQRIEADGAMVSLRNALVTGKVYDAWMYLAEVEKKRPETRLNPELMVLKADFFQRLKRPRAAAYWYDAVLRMNPSESTAAYALLKLGEFYESRGDRAKASVCRRTILSKYPRSREAISAKKKEGK